MAQQKKQQPAYDDETDYVVQFAKVVKHKRTTFRPKSDYPAIKGRVLNELPVDTIASAVPA